MGLWTFTFPDLALTQLGPTEILCREWSSHKSAGLNLIDTQIFLGTN